MNTSIQPATAKIYQFPSRPRSTASARHDAVSAATVTLPPGACDAAFGGSWYHDDAISDARRDAKS